MAKYFNYLLYFTLVTSAVIITLGLTSDCGYDCMLSVNGVTGIIENIIAMIAIFISMIYFILRFIRMKFKN